MDQRIIWKLVVLLGCLPFVIPIVMGLYTMTIESWELFDWLVFWSVIYWPTYVVGILCIVVAVYKLKDR